MFSGPEDKNCTSYVIPEGVTEIGHTAFQGCSELTEIEIPASVTTVETNAFLFCAALKTIKVPEGTDVGEWGLDDGVQVIYY